MKNQDIYRDKIQNLHDKYGITFMFMSKKIGISSGYISKWLNGYDVSPEMFDKILEYYDSIPLKDEVK